jgi:ribosomal protein S18 acetylase RimI-like enzyme
VEGPTEPFAAPKTIAPLAAGPDVTAVTGLLARSLGTGWFARGVVARFAAETGSDRGGGGRFGLVARDPDGGGLSGALLVSVETPDELPSSFLAGYEEIKNDPAVLRLRRERAVGLISAIAVDEGARRRGVASQLLDAGLRALAARGIAACYAFAWTSARSGCHAGGVFARRGFAPVRRFEDAYAQFSVRNDCRCPFCGRPPCRCAAWLYVRAPGDAASTAAAPIAGTPGPHSPW